MGLPYAWVLFAAAGVLIAAGALVPLFTGWWWPYLLVAVGVIGFVGLLSARMIWAIYKAGAPWTVERPPEWRGGPDFE